METEQPHLPKCPHCGAMINPGSLLGMMNLGRKKNFTKKQRTIMRQNLANARLKRWPHKQPEPIAA